MSSPDRIADHHSKWGPLPQFPDYPYVMDDSDVEAWSDLLYMRELVDAIEDMLDTPESAHDVLAGAENTDGRGLLEYEIDTYLDPWPADLAAEMLAAWREGDDYLRAGVPGAEWVLGDRVPPAPSKRPRWWRRTFHKRTVRRLAAASAIAAFVIVGIGYAAAPAKADPGIGCERISWGLHFLTPQKRTICDGPRRADGSWERFRQLWTPAHYVPLRTSCYGTYSISCTTTGGYAVDDQIWEEQTYVVFDHNVLPDEPGWLPPGTAVLR